MATDEIDAASQPPSVTVANGRVTTNYTNHTNKREEKREKTKRRV